MKSNANVTYLGHKFSKMVCGQSIKVQQCFGFSRHTKQLTRSFLFSPHNALPREFSPLLQSETINTKQYVLELSSSNYDPFMSPVHAKLLLNIENKSKNRIRKISVTVYCNL